MTAALIAAWLVLLFGLPTLAYVHASRAANDNQRVS